MLIHMHTIVDSEFLKLVLYAKKKKPFILLTTSSSLFHFEVSLHSCTSCYIQKVPSQLYYFVADSRSSLPMHPYHLVFTLSQSLHKNTHAFQCACAQAQAYMHTHTHTCTHTQIHTPKITSSDLGLH
jgi:hypothetical protein